MASNQPSITSTDTFLARAQRSEERRIWIWVGVLIAVLALVIVRHLLHGAVMASNAVFVPSVGVLIVSIALQVALLWVLRRANRRMTLLPDLLWRATAIFDLCVPAALMLILVFESPRGKLAAISAPVLLLMPIVVLTSVLRLRPMFTLYTGLAAAGFHVAITVHAIQSSPVDAHLQPVLFSYSVALLFFAIASVLVARDVKGHVREAADEAAAHEQAERRIAVVEHDLAIARDIQSGLLPRHPPSYRGFDIAGMNRPAAQTGGDYYDWQELPDGRLVTVLADVTGHGIGPAIVMAVCRAYARASASVLREPSELMERLNELLIADLPSDRFITFALAMLQPDGRVELLSAGHGPTFLYRAADDSIQQFNGDGLPLGVAAGEYRPTTSFQMHSGDVLVMLTDGFFEWSRPLDGEQFGIQRLSESVLAGVKGSAAGMIQAMDNAVLTFTAGSSQPDDMTALVIKRTE